MKKSFLLGLVVSVIGAITCNATPVQVKMNAISETMSLVSKADGSSVDIGQPANKIYNFDVAPGDYILTGMQADGTVNGTISLSIPDASELQEYAVFTHYIYVANTDADKQPWVYGVDYTTDVKVTGREGESYEVTVGDNSTYKERKCVLSFSGNSLYINFIPSEEHTAEGYMTTTLSATTTFNTTQRATIPMGYGYTVTIPSGAKAELGRKGAHFTEFEVIEPQSVVENGATVTYNYRLPGSNTLNLRTWKSGGLTQAFYFTKGAKDESVEFTEADYAAYNPKQVNHDPTSNEGFETGDIFVNINPRSHLLLKQGETFDAHAMRTWQLTDNSTNNYFFEPDFHFTVLDLNDKPSTGVIEISSDDTTSPWRTIKAVGQGEAIVLVTYDAIGVTRGDKDTPYMGGKYWGAIWPENTAAFVVSVGAPDNAIEPNMEVNEAYNIGEDGKPLAKLAGKYVDAEHDVFYYLDTEEGYNFTFTPAGVAEVTLAYPQIGENAATYTGFGSEGVTANADGSYTLLLKHGRNIVKLTDASGNSVYQVIKALACHREIINESRSSSEKFYPGDKVKIQYSGLFHPANKLAGIYNMSAYITYNGTPNGTSLILGPNQYTFGSTPKAQAVEFVIPENYDISETPYFVLNEGVLQVTGFGDPIGNHRNIIKTAGRSPNFTAIAHKTYFGAIPDVSLPVYERKLFNFTVKCNAPDAEFTISKDGVALTPDEDGNYQGYAGFYSISASASGYRCFRTTYEVLEEMDSNHTINITMASAPDAWDGKTLTEPAILDDVYQIATAAEFAWYGASIGTQDATTQNGVLLNDIDLGDYDWSATKKFEGTFDGANHKIEGLYINKPTTQNQGLFSTIAGGTVKNVSIYGCVTGAGNVGAIAASTTGENSSIENCANYASVSGGTGTVGGIIGRLAYESDRVENCINAGTLQGKYVGGIIGNATKASTLHNLLNVGEFMPGATQYGACVNSTLAFTDANMFALETENDSYIDSDTQIVSAERMASGEIARLLGAAFGQTLGEDAYPVLNGKSVYKVSYIFVENNGDAAAETEELYTNGELPSSLNGEDVTWYVDEEMTKPVIAVDADRLLYVQNTNTVGINNVGIDGESSAIRWFGIDGVAVPEPASNAHGIFIRVVNGRSQKVVL